MRCCRRRRCDGAPPPSPPPARTLCNGAPPPSPPPARTLAPLSLLCCCTLADVVQLLVACLFVACLLLVWLHKDPPSKTTVRGPTSAFQSGCWLPTGS